MTWYAARTIPGSQKPQREYTVETTKSAKGYRIVPSLNPEMSAVERALEDAGVEFYMPAEKRLVRDRRRPYLWKTRRFALMVGYIFVRCQDGLTAKEWHRLMTIPGIIGIVGSEEGPMQIDFFDMLQIFDAERKTEIDFMEESRKARQGLRKAAKTNPAIQKIVDQLDIAGTVTVPYLTVTSGTVTFTTGDLQGDRGEPRPSVAHIPRHASSEALPKI